MWHLLTFKLTKRSHAVQKLACHLKNEQQVDFRNWIVNDWIFTISHHKVVFEAGEEESAIERGELGSTLTAWMQANGPGNIDDPQDKLTEEDRAVARTITYPNFPTEFVFLNHSWKRRKVGKGKTIGRVPIVPLNPHTMELYALRLILHNTAGASSFEELMTVNGQLRSSFQAAAIALNLLEDDRELDKAVQEAYTFKFGEPLRSLFVSILLFTRPSDPRQFYEDHKLQILEDWIHESNLAEAESRSSFQFVPSNNHGFDQVPQRPPESPPIERIESGAIWTPFASQSSHNLSSRCLCQERTRSLRRPHRGCEGEREAGEVEHQTEAAV